MEEWNEHKKGPKPETDVEKIKARLNDELLFKAYKFRLGKNDCFNRGFVIDGFPKNYE